MIGAFSRAVVRNFVWVVMVVATGALCLAQQGPTFRSETDLVTVGVTVADRRGVLRTDLQAAHFEVLEDGKRQTVTFFARGDQAESAPEIHVGLLLDTSGSMGMDMQLARSAAVKFLNTLREAVDITLVDFDTEARMAKYEQQDFPRLVERIRSRKPDGFTALYDALALYLNSTDGVTGRPILVLLSDGGDTRSTIGFGDVLTLLKASTVTVYAIGFLEHQSSSSRDNQRIRLTQLATESGGRAFFPRTIEEIGEAYDKVVGEIRGQYSLGYASTNLVRDGKWRKVEVAIKHPDAKALRVQSRRGYFAPRDPSAQRR
jgi:Ca-activated chloride channel family protein